MNQFTQESQDALNRAWDLHLTAEHVEAVIRFMSDLEYGREVGYVHVQLQQAATNRRLYHLPPRGLMAIVDWYPPESGEGGWLLDLVSVYHDPSLEDAGPWQLP